jgi:hypothetical protein
MAVTKEHKEFFAVDFDGGWATPPGYPDGIQEKTLAGALDEANGRGSRTRLLRFQPGVHTTVPFVHEHWEEVYLVSGDLWVGNDENGQGGEQFQANTYACRPPGVPHGPFRSEGGCVLFEIHYFDPA